jgi:hypothetical protein
MQLYSVQPSQPNRRQRRRNRVVPLLGAPAVAAVPAQGVAFQRPLCAYPERAEYVGTGDPNDAANFQCVAHNDPFDPRNIGPQRAYKEGR